MKLNVIRYCPPALLIGSVARHNAIRLLMACALLSISIVPSQVRAYPVAAVTGAPQATHIDLYKNIWINPGLARGQTLRYTWANQNNPDPAEREIEPLRIRVRLLSPDRSVIAQTEAPAVGVGEFQYFDFNRDEISLPGEVLTGRLQTLLEATVSGVKYRHLILKNGIVETFDDTIEVFDNFVGGTTVGYGRGVNQIVLDDSPGTEHVNPDAFQIISAGKDAMVGLVTGQSLRVSARNPFDPSVGDGRKFKMLFAVSVLLADGRVIAESDEITLDPGEFHFFEFKRSDFPVSGETGGRVQARVIYAKLRLQTEFPSSIEIVDGSTGKTTLLLPQKPKEIVVVGSH
jgi:hypothetical protein